MAYLTMLRGQSLLVFRERPYRTKGGDARKNNIAAARIVAETLKADMDRMLFMWGCKKPQSASILFRDGLKESLMGLGEQ
ncbi:MAG: hypothetical protein RMJ07_04460 [Nitrososphaerota archaeon]|nr:hypothetical protein [Candidatus Bathyarchaeota archaeon]MDW8048916.1 hypothetical protein [Nitrososphaerota archaeon]